jgi:hypothetical protein
MLKPWRALGATHRTTMSLKERRRSLIPTTSRRGGQLWGGWRGGGWTGGAKKGSCIKLCISWFQFELLGDGCIELCWTCFKLVWCCGCVNLKLYDSLNFSIWTCIEIWCVFRRSTQMSFGKFKMHSSDRSGINPMVLFNRRDTYTYLGY